MNRPALGTVLGATACLVALCSTGVAADAASLISGKNIKPNSITTAQIKNGTLTNADMAPGTLTAGGVGPQGPQGVPGPMGAAGTSKASGLVSSGGSLTRGQLASGVVLTVSRVATGVYCIKADTGATALTNSSNVAVATADYSSTGSTTIAQVRSSGIGCPAGQFAVYTWDSGTATDAGFSFMIN